MVVVDAVVGVGSDDMGDLVRQFGREAQPLRRLLRRGQPEGCQFPWSKVYGPTENGHVQGSMDRGAGHAFVSYVRDDARHVDELHRVLQAAGISVWRDTDNLWPGEDWRARIRDAITKDALVFIACFSRGSAARMTSYQNEELRLAVEQLRMRRPDVPWLIPVRFDDCVVPEFDIGDGRTLASLQRADLFGENADAQMTRLLTSVQRLLGQPSGEDPPLQRASPSLVADDVLTRMGDVVDEDATSRTTRRFAVAGGVAVVAVAIGASVAIYTQIHPLHRANSSPPPTVISFSCKVESGVLGSGLDYEVIRKSGAAYIGKVNVSFYDHAGSGDTFSPATLDGTAAAGSMANWRPVPPADIGASAAPTGCKASAAGG